MALKELRSASKGWVFWLLAVPLLVSFGVFWNTSDMFRSLGGKGVAKVGGEWITIPEFQEKLRTTTERLSRQQGKPLSLDFVQENRLGPRIADEMVSERAL